MTRKYVLCAALLLAACDPSGVSVEQTEASVDGRDASDNGRDASGPTESEGGKCKAYVDADGDGLGAGKSVSIEKPKDGCDDLPSGYASNDDDEDDSCAVELAALYIDADGDGYGVGESTENACPKDADGGDLVPPDGMAFADGDCDDDLAKCGAACHPGAAEICDGFDNVCAGAVPAGEVDADGDGSPACADCDDDPAGCGATCHPGASELCDAIDNDCDGLVDDNGQNACGGPCSEKLEQKPGDACENGQKGACLRAGKFLCQPDMTLACNAPPVTPSAEVCGDSIDNDCDGIVDDSDAVDALTWFQDCDLDGFAASLAGSVKSCVKPANSGGCGWTQTVPQSDTKRNWDCDDSNAAYSPLAAYGKPAGGSTSWDLNCDGVLTKDPNYVPPSRSKFCPIAVVAWANQASGGLCDASSGVGGEGCQIYKNAAGVYERAPTTACPDTGHQIIFDDNFGTCSIGTRASTGSWPCR